MNIAVFLGANYGNNPKINEETEKLGTWIGNHHHTLVYGGSKTGLMNTLATATLKTNGKVIGVEMKLFHEDGASFSGLSDFYVCDTLSARKEKIMTLSDAFIAMPGGTGTLDEISEIMCLDKISPVHRPIILFNIDHFYDDLKQLLEKMVVNGFLQEKDKNLIHFCSTLEEIETIIKK